ncbi:hypothetical protein AEAE_0989 [Aeriscardovia aeriphila]|uniref:Peptidase M10 metallopeptidase domain-containing protein n=2 Tax=Aeriscardovia aeriphila TaxID=218139 RepID=A0A261FBH0_9BIFI|nr:hypothetical protein AEAE_0989 [Aeriscardovia aeriphila]
MNTRKGNYNSQLFGFRLLGKAVLVFLIILGVSSAIPTHSAYAYSTYPAKWDSSIQMIRAYGDVSGVYSTALNQAIDNYNTQTHVHLSRNNNGKMLAQARYYGGTNWIGFKDGSQNVAGYTNSDADKYPRKRITWADVMLNKSIIRPSTPIGKVRLIWLHELGHAWGLGHSDYVHTVMYANADQSYKSGVEYLTTDDVRGINSKY